MLAGKLGQLLTRQFSLLRPVDRGDRHPVHQGRIWRRILFEVKGVLKDNLPFIAQELFEVNIEFGSDLLVQKGGLCFPFNALQVQYSFFYAFADATVFIYLLQVDPNTIMDINSAGLEAVAGVCFGRRVDRVVATSNASGAPGGCVAAAL